MINKLLRSLIFPCVFRIAIIALQKMSGNVYSYPMVVYLTFNKKEVKKKYINGNSLTYIIEARAKLMAVTMTRHMKRKPLEFGSELYARYYSWCETQTTAREIEDFIKEYNLNVNPTPNEKDKR